MSEFTKRLDEIAVLINDGLVEILDGRVRSGETARPQRLVEAMRHGTLNGGKRLRPFLVIESARMFGVKQAEALYAAMALECIHCYSLIHDDLPAMDDDDLRRGEPTVHKAFDEATAILAGDSLLTMAFELIGDEKCHFDPLIRCKLIQLLAQAAGIGGMAGGQMLDLQAEEKQLNVDDVSQLQAMKTGALIRFACECGAILGQASAEEQFCMRKFGQTIGAAFQLADDILDVTATSQEMGKQTGKDKDRGKGTLVDLLGLEEAQIQARKLVGQADQLLEPFGKKGAMLGQCAHYIVERDY